jgi:hypothetical protein
LRIAFESADVACPLIQCALSIVAKWRVTEVVSQAGHVNHVWAYAKFCSHFTPNLSYF